jgi:hypothetical protein
VELDKKFREIVTDKLDPRSKEALCMQEDPAAMSDAEAVKIRKSIMSRVYGNIHFGTVPMCVVFYKPNSDSWAGCASVHLII